jgi:hypothetical protein
MNRGEMGETGEQFVEAELYSDSGFLLSPHYEDSEEEAT